MGRRKVSWSLRSSFADPPNDSLGRLTHMVWVATVSGRSPLASGPPPSGRSPDSLDDRQPQTRSDRRREAPLQCLPARYVVRDGQNQGVAGWWRPRRSADRQSIQYIRGGWTNWGRYLDDFRTANLVTNLKPPIRPMRIHNHYITASAKTYAEARPNEPFVYLGSMGF